MFEIIPNNNEQAKKFSSEEKVIDILLENYVDKEGNLIGWQEFEYNNNPNYQTLRSCLDKGQCYDLEEFLYDKENLDRIINKFDKEKALIEKIKLIKIVGDISKSVIQDMEGGEFVDKANNFLKIISSDKENTYLIRSYAHLLYAFNLQWGNWHLPADGIEDIKEAEKFKNIFQEHDRRFDVIDFEFSSEMINKMNYESRDYGTPLEIKSSFEAEPGKDYLVRIIAPSIIGVFTKTGNLIGWHNFNEAQIKKLSDSEYDIDQVFNEADAHGEIEWEKIFLAIGNKEIKNKALLNSPLEIKDQINFKIPQEDQVLFRILSSIPFRNQIKNDIGFDLSEYNLRNQYQLLQFIKDSKEENVDQLKKFISNGQKKNRVKAFLSMEIDEKDGEKIIEIANRLELKDAEDIFAKIAELTDLAQEKDQELKQIIFKDSQKELPANVRTELLRKAHNIISRFSDELRGGEKIDEEKIQKLLSDLEQSRIEIDLVASLLIAAKKQGETQRLEDIRGVEMRTVGEKELAEDDALATRLKEMYRSANAHKSKEDLERLMNDFEEHKKHNPEFYLLYFDASKNDHSGKDLDSLVGFTRASSFGGQKELPEGERYLGAMNIDPLLQKFLLGENFSREIVEKELAAGAKKLIAHVPENGASHKILRNLGFKDAAQEGEYKDNGGRVIAKRIRVELTKE